MAWGDLGAADPRLDLGQIEGDQLGKEQATHNAQAQWAVGFFSGALAEGDRQDTEQRAHRGHHDRTEMNLAALVGCFVLCLAFTIPDVPGEVDLYEAGLLDDADQGAKER